MYEKSVKVTSKVGIHARPAAEIVKLANKFESDVTIVKGPTEVNGKSIMGIMLLAIAPGSEIIIKAQGQDEHDLVEGLIELINNNFNL